MYIMYIRIVLRQCNIQDITLFDNVMHQRKHLKMSCENIDHFCGIALIGDLLQQ